MGWKYIVGQGIENSVLDQAISFGCRKKDLRKLLAFDKTKNVGRSSSEDRYKNIFKSKLDLRINFDKSGLRELEILNGELYVGEIKVAIGSSFSVAAKRLENSDPSVIKHTYGCTFPSLKLDIGDSEKNGAEKSEVCWIYMSDNIDHLTD